MIIDFVEVGTCCFDAYSMHAPGSVTGINIEPVQEYLDMLPDREGVEKLCCAVVEDPQEKEAEVFFIPPEEVRKNNLPNWIRGCNKVGGYHYQHQMLGIKDLVEIRVVPAFTLEEILDEREITRPSFLKLDLEGMDCDILLSHIPYLIASGVESYPDKIKIETNVLTPWQTQDQAILETLSMGYSLQSKNHANTVFIWNRPRD